MKVYVVKHALTQGILVYDNAELCDRPFMIKISPKNSYMMFFHKNEWTTTEEKALELAEILRERKIKSLEKQLEKMKNLEIKVNEKCE